jgi:hypothetical protein
MEINERNLILFDDNLNTIRNVLQNNHTNTKLQISPQYSIRINNYF